MSRAVVLGAAGFIGRRAARALAQRGLEVIGLGHGDWAGSAPADWGLARWQAGDIGLETLDALVGEADVDVYLHCAGGSAVGASYAAPLTDFHRSVSTTAALLEHVRRRGRGRVVLASSAAVYGDQGDVDLTETSGRSPMSPYGFHKQAAEQVGDSYARFFGVDVGVVRLFSVYGEGLRKQLLWDAANKLMRGETGFFGTGHELRDWIHVDDAATLLAAVATTPSGRFDVYNGGHVHASTRQVLGTLAQALDLPLVPAFNGEAHSGNPRRLTADCSHARRQLGWTPTVALADGLRRYARWFLQAHGSAA